MTNLTFQFYFICKIIILFKKIFVLCLFICLLVKYVLYNFIVVFIATVIKFYVNYFTFCSFKLLLHCYSSRFLLISARITIISNARL